MSDITYTLEPTDIMWEMNWAKYTDKDGNRVHPDKPDTEMIFERDKAICHLIMNEVLFLNSHHWKKDWPEDARKATSLLVNCSDMFAWGCSDAEEITVEEIKELYMMWKENPEWGATLWCMKKRREMPQGPVDQAMRKAGVDLDTFQKEHNIRDNCYSGIGMLFAQFKYKHYSEWAAANGMTVRPFDAQWWAGWDEFRKANPNWEKEVGEKAWGPIADKFRSENGW